ncbi:complex I NDUFA9 subunit family protein [Crenobacter cavernae]|nr:complex I NDUFA9 subunit family protein [Crenobacter cavernae]
MKVFVTGAGFIGARLIAALKARGHEVDSPARREKGGAREFDLAYPEPDAWERRLQGVDVVVNTVGAFRGDLEAVHHSGPAALFAAAGRAGVGRAVQLSALGAAVDAPQLFLASKGRGDAALGRFGGEARVLRPSLVFGPGGASSRMMLKLARLPLWPLPEGGRQRLQPVHVDDVVDALVRFAEGQGGQGATIAAVGPREMSLADYLQTLRRGSSAKALELPAALVDTVAALAERWPNSLLTRDSLAMLSAGSVADAAPFSRLLGRAPRDPATFQDGEPR